MLVTVTSTHVDVLKSLVHAFLFINTVACSVTLISIKVVVWAESRNNLLFSGGEIEKPHKCMP